MPTTGRSGSRAAARTARWFTALAGLVLLAAASAPGQQDRGDSAAIGRMVRDASRAIQAGNAASFLGYFDEAEFAGFAELRKNTAALTAQRQIASSIEITETERLDQGYRVRISWLLQLSYTGDPGPVETRQELVTCIVKRMSNSWKIVDLDPVSHFRP
jgi:hypothetical protein